MTTDCPTGKRGYPTAPTAWRVLQRLTGTAAKYTHKFPAKPGGHVYHCPQCGQFHITSARRKERSPAMPRYRTTADEDFIADLRLDVAYERHYQHILTRHPDCRDPLHPGCNRCEDREGNPIHEEGSFA